ncbi:hypothetical protein [Paenibacillus sp. NEAU-GSW1]|uniref:hypothetical protein n=1 Tax=Paenibacillus sp. NEAU-GSW1 TaxID=2682486 RepID=UPI0012E22AF7|nr:hypothetical protein [Paenibacillus sp. NEAU-GSW1]MUT64632.1 hypothetical protein [Paenibacillus sp. NEAU-GSW1]
MNLFMKPARIGEVLDRSFQLYRKHFVTAYTLALILMGPLYLLQNLLLLNDASFLPQDGMSVEQSFERYAEASNGLNGDQLNVGYILFLFLFMPLYLVFVAPAAAASQLHVVLAAAEGRAMRIGELLKRGFAPYWRITGNSVLFGLIMIGVYIVLFMAIMAFVFIFMLLAVGIGAGFMTLSDDPFGGGVAAIILFVIVYLLLVAGVTAGLAFFAIRFGFYLPVLTLEHGSSPLARSWKLTKGSFWRVYATFLVVMLVSSIFIIGGYVISIGIFKLSIIGQILYVLIMLLALPLILLTYGVVYFDLKGRSEGADIANDLAAVDAAERSRAAADERASESFAPIERKETETIDE